MTDVLLSHHVPLLVCGNTGTGARPPPPTRPPSPPRPPFFLALPCPSRPPLSSVPPSPPLSRSLPRFLSLAPCRGVFASPPGARLCHPEPGHLPGHLRPSPRPLRLCTLAARSPTRRQDHLGPRPAAARPAAGQVQDHLPQLFSADAGEELGFGSGLGFGVVPPRL